MDTDHEDSRSVPAVKQEKIVPFKTHQGRRKGKPRAKPFTIIDNEVLDDLRLSMGARFCYVILRRRKNKEGTCWPTHIQIGNDCKVKERTVSTWVHELKALGYLDWQHYRDDYGQLRNRYIFTDPEVVTQQQCIAAGQQQPVAANQTHNTLYSVTTSPPIQEDSPVYGRNEAAL